MGTFFRGAKDDDGTRSGSFARGGPKRELGDEGSPPCNPRCDQVVFTSNRIVWFVKGSTESDVNRSVAWKSVKVFPKILAPERVPLGSAVAVECWPPLLNFMTMLPPVGVMTKSVESP